MKTSIGILVLLLLLSACKKGQGDMKYVAKYTTNTASVKSAESALRYTEFGTYITSITPSHFSCKMNMLVFQDKVSHQDPGCHMVSFVDGHDNQPGYEIASYADFSGNAEVEVTPILYSTDIRDGLFEQERVDFRFLTFTPIYFDHEFEIPVEYLGVVQNSNSNNFLSGSVFNYDQNQNKISVATKRIFSYQAIHGNANARPTNFSVVFGNTESSYIYTYHGDLPEAQRFPFWDQSGAVIIRSNNFSSLPIVMPGEGETNTMYSTIAFDTNELIQVYAGNDNIPYTIDDVFTYAPQFWDRLKVTLKMING